MVFNYTGRHSHLKLPGRKDGEFIHFTPSTTRTLAHELGHTRGIMDDGGSVFGAFASVRDSRFNRPEIRGNQGVSQLDFRIGLLYC